MSDDKLALELFFIIGAPRSGTTLLQSILSAHSTLHIPPETSFFMGFADRFDAAPRDQQAFEKVLNAFLSTNRWQDQGLSEDELRRKISQNGHSARGIFLALLQLHAARSGKPRIGEKSPHHCRHVAAIQARFPQARFIHIYRDPRDVVASRLRMPWTTGSYLATAREWQRIAAEHQSLTNSISSDLYTSIRFESLVENPEIEIRRICEFLGTEFEPGMLDRTQPETDENATHDPREHEWKARASQPITTARIGVYAATLSPRRIHGIERICTREMTQLGYSHSPLRPRKLIWVIVDSLEKTSDILRRWYRSAGKRLRLRRVEER